MLKAQLSCKIINLISLSSSFTIEPESTQKSLSRWEWRVRASAKVLHPQSRKPKARNLSVCENKFTWNWTSCNWFRGPARRIMFANYWRCSLVEICCCWRCLFSGFLSFRRREDEMKEDFMKLKFQLSTSFESSLHGAAVSSRTSDRGRFSPKTSLHQYFYCFPKATWKLINIVFVVHRIARWWRIGRWWFK